MIDSPAARFWSLIRDIIIAALAIFMLIHETIDIEKPDPIIVGAAVTLLGVPAALRADRRRVRQNGSH